MKTWFYNRNLKPQGPFSLEEMRQKIFSGEVGPHDLICDDTDGRWKMAMEFRLFETGLYPAAQEVNVQNTEESVQVKEWILLVGAENGSMLQEGPFSQMELRQKIQERSVSTQQYVWKQGLTGWCQIKDRPEFISETL
jgi:hypothetical protein